MNTIKLSLPAAILLMLAACAPAQNEAPAASAPAASAASTVAAGDAAASGLTDIAPAEHQTVINDAKWQDYRCDGGKTLQARYHAGEATAVAQVKIDGHTLTLQYDGVQSNEDLTAFSGGSYSWVISNLHRADFYKEDNGFLFQQEQQKINDESLPVDNILVKNCAPAS